LGQILKFQLSALGASDRLFISMMGNLAGFIDGTAFFNTSAYIENTLTNAEKSKSLNGNTKLTILMQLDVFEDTSYMWNKTAPITQSEYQRSYYMKDYDVNNSYFISNK
jgi:hypothetical protein